MCYLVIYAKIIYIEETVIEDDMMADNFFAFLKDKFNIILTDAQKEAVAQKDGKVVLISTPAPGRQPAMFAGVPI